MALWGAMMRLFAAAWPELVSDDEYGIPTTSGGAAQLTPANGARFGYTGQAWIPELGMYHYKARVYSPTLGRFLQTDPIGYAETILAMGSGMPDPIANKAPKGKTTTTAALIRAG
jgi:RHS repeat-associated protein